MAQDNNSKRIIMGVKGTKPKKEKGDRESEKETEREK